MRKCGEKNYNKNKFREHQRSIKAKKSAASAATDYLDFPELDLDESELEEEGSEVDSEPELRQFFLAQRCIKKIICLEGSHILVPYILVQCPARTFSTSCYYGLG